MDNSKSILEKIAETVKDIATIAADAANYALKAEVPPLKAGEPAVADMPLATGGLVPDPMMVPPLAVAPARNKRRAAPKRAAMAGKKARAKKSRTKVRKGTRTTT
jgi:hypothetical protein